MQRMRAVDFFCGTGGFSRGALEAGFDVAVAYDNDPILTSSHSKNFPKTKLKLRDIRFLTGEEVRMDAGGPIDFVFGGPPCQGFSAIGKRDEADPRRELLAHFFRLVAKLEPAVFVMENVQGLTYANARAVLDDALALVPKKYVVLEPIILDASDFGAATNRKRMFVIGFDPDRCSTFDVDEILTAKSSAVNVADALSGLGSITKVRSRDIDSDEWRIHGNKKLSEYARKLVSKDRSITGNQRTVHSAKILKRFAALKAGETDKIGRHLRLEWNGQCPTLRAGTGPDKGSHQAVRPIHPEEDRVITVREAARLQGFPDKHYFHHTIWHSFRMIGNSVSPIISYAICRIIINALDKNRYLLEAAE